MEQCVEGKAGVGMVRLNLAAKRQFC